MLSVCKGYELTQDLSFDTRRDGLINHRDAYWNNGVGWDPIGGEFTATLDGNGEATLTWTAIAGVSGWQLRQDGGGYWTAIADSDDQTSEHTVGDLDGGTTYTFRVWAVAGSGDTLVDGVASNAVSVTSATSPVTMVTYTVTHVRIDKRATGSAADVLAAVKTLTGLGNLAVTVTAGSSNADILAAADALTRHSVTSSSRYIDADGSVWNFTSGRPTGCSSWSRLQRWSPTP